MSVPEQWQPIPGHPGYEASTLGRIRSRWIRGGRHDRGRQLGLHWRALAGWVNPRGYQMVNLVVDDTYRICPVHTVIAETFHGPRPTGAELRHLNGEKLDNRPDNLRWGTQSENVLDRVRHGAHHNAIKTHCKRGHEFTPENIYLLPKSGSRVCRTCVRDRRARLREAS